MKRWLGVWLLMMVATAGLAQDYDILIRNGRVVDGSGNPWYDADIAIRDGCIAAMGRLEGASAPVVLDASDLYVAPGFIDVHSHAAQGLTQPAKA